MSTEAESLLSKKIPVASTALSSELSRIRKNAAKNDGREDGVEVKSDDPRVRATLSNLVLLVSSRCSSFDNKAIENLITELCVAHPSRFFIIEYGGELGESSSLSTAVSSRCVFANSGVKVCSEEVYIAAGHENVDLVPNLLLSMLVPDIDVVLLVLGDPENDFCSSSQETLKKGFQELLCGLYGVSDLVMFDSSLFQEYGLSQAALSSQPFEDDTSTVVSKVRKKDVNWNRTKRWRNLLAEQFDATHDLHVARHVDSITFGCACTSDDFKSGCLPSDAILLAGWVAACLNWEIGEVTRKEDDGVSLSVNSQAGQLATINFSSVPQEEVTNARFRLRSILLEMKSGEDKMRVELSRLVEKDLVEISTEISAYGSGDDASCDLFMRRAPFPVETVVQMLSAGVASSDIDKGYSSALTIAEKIASLL